MMPIDWAQVNALILSGGILALGGWLWKVERRMTRVETLLAVIAGKNTEVGDK